MRPVLYSFRRCPYAMRARLALAVSGQLCELREVVLRNKPGALLQASPKGTVPVLVLPHGEVLEQSLDIMLWALAQHDPQRWLLPPAGNQADMMSLIASCDEEFKQGLDRYKYPQRFDNVDPIEQRERCSAWLMGLESRLQEKQGNAEVAGNSPAYLLGDRACLADAAIMPFVRQFAQVDRGWFDAQPWPALHTWLASWLDAALFAAVMHKYTPWAEGQGVEFP